MEFITTTQLRTQSVALVQQLVSGAKVKLVHRSKVVGSIVPESEQYKVFNANAFSQSLRAILPKKLLSKDKREKMYRIHLVEKYG